MRRSAVESWVPSAATCWRLLTLGGRGRCRGGVVARLGKMAKPLGPEALCGRKLIDRGAGAGLPEPAVEGVSPVVAAAAEGP